MASIKDLKHSLTVENESYRFSRNVGNYRSTLRNIYSVVEVWNHTQFLTVNHNIVLSARKSLVYNDTKYSVLFTSLTPDDSFSWKLKLCMIRIFPQLFSVTGRPFLTRSNSTLEVTEARYLRCIIFQFVEKEIACHKRNTLQFWKRFFLFLSSFCLLFFLTVIFKIFVIVHAAITVPLSCLKKTPLDPIMNYVWKLKFIFTYFADVRIYIYVVFMDVQKFSSTLQS